MPNSKGRFFLLKILVVLMLCAVLWKLMELQLVNGEEYKEIAEMRLTTNIVEKAPRGEIFDRYGTSLVSNKVGYCVVMQKAGMSDEELNKVFEKTTALLKGDECEYYDTFPISFEPYKFEFVDDNNNDDVNDDREKWFEDNIYKKKIDKDMSASAVIEAFKEIYKIDASYSEEQARRIIGARYEADLHGFSSTTPFTIADDVVVDVVTKIKELQDIYKGVSITNDYVREYKMPGLATHILGRTGKISAEEYQEKKEVGYGMNDIIGKQGIEKWAEEYLKGEDGTSGSMKKSGIRDITVAEDKEPVPGNYVVLTIDSELQRTVEESLDRNIKKIRNSGGNKNKDGGDCDSGAAVVIDVKTGDVLACASYPTYDMSRFNEDYSSLVENNSKPLWNRAVSGTYSPGSTFKPFTAIAAMQTGNLTPDEIIEDMGVYKYYADYQPACWIWNDTHTTHGKINVSGAIENSCNYFFYEVGRRTGIDTLDAYAAKFGLGEKTGIELDEETTGHMASPEYKKRIVESATSRDWYGGDTLQAAIGQSYSIFTPVQLANYTATIANGGVRHKVNLIKSIHSSVDGSVVKNFEPEVLDSIDVSSDVINSVREGMKRVVDEGSASNIFQDFPIQIGGKTGTPQLGNGSNNAVFIAYAPFNDPQIAISVVLEHGVSGSNAGYVAKDILNKYFSLSSETASPKATSQSATAAPAEATEAPAVNNTVNLLP